jgi:hypothetical protein
MPLLSAGLKQINSVTVISPILNTFIIDEGVFLLGNNLFSSNITHSLVEKVSRANAKAGVFLMPCKAPYFIVIKAVNKS